MGKSSLFLVFIVSLGFAQGFFVSSDGSYEVQKAVYNSRISDAPSTLRFLFSGERANLEVSGVGDFRVLFGDRGEVLEILPGSWEKPSLEIGLGKSTLVALNSGQLDLEDAVEYGMLQLTARNIIVLVKLQIAQGFISAGGAWGSFFGPGLDRLFSSLPF
ncbi:hypothetical protein GF415_03615 [Candidatus Micrarchaeota archaeon]|nr:hypothetical protein [Candidatus Micrarchaeota archaeon]